jgi:hypothetical protein
LLVETKTSDSDVDSNSDSELNESKQITDTEPSVAITTTKVQPKKPEEPKEGQRHFHSEMWMKGNPLHFIVDSGSQKNLISAEVINRLNLTMMPHHHPYTIDWLNQGRDIHIIQQCRLHYVIKPFKDGELCDVSPLEVCDVLLGQPHM